MHAMCQDVDEGSTLDEAPVKSDILICLYVCLNDLYIIFMDNWHPSNNPSNHPPFRLSVNPRPGYFCEGCFIFHFASLPLEVARPIQPKSCTKNVNITVFSEYRPSLIVQKYLRSLFVRLSVPMPVCLHTRVLPWQPLYLSAYLYIRLYDHVFVRIHLCLRKYRCDRTCKYVRVCTRTCKCTNCLHLAVFPYFMS